MSKRQRFFSIVVAVATIFALCIMPTCAAVTRASAYINSYRANVLPAGSGALGIEFTVVGTGTMSAIGAESITIYQSVGSKWVYVGGFTRSDDGMTDTNTAYHGNTMMFYGISGEEYKVTVTIFAENSNGSDSRTVNYILVA